MDDELRATGRTTRLVDKYIQDLFNNRGEWITVIDHWGSRHANDYLVERIIKRFHNEYNAVIVASLKFDFARHRLQLKK